MPIVKYVEYNTKNNVKRVDALSYFVLESD